MLLGGVVAVLASLPLPLEGAGVDLAAEAEDLGVEAGLGATTGLGVSAFGTAFTTGVFLATGLAAGAALVTDFAAGAVLAGVFATGCVAAFLPLSLPLP